MRRLSIGLVGCGGLMNAHLAGYRVLYTGGLRVFDIKAVCDVSERNALEKAEAVARFQDRRPKVYRDFEEMIRREDLDAVDIALPHNLHHTVACRCLEEGLHVMIEKPLGITMRAARLIIDAAERHNRVLAVAENYRRSPENRAIWWAIRRGYIGEPRMVVWVSAGWNPKPWGWREDRFKAGGSWVFDGGVHLADLDRYQLGREAVEVYAVTETFNPVKEGVKVTVDDMTMAIIKYDGGVYAQWLWTGAAPGKSMNLRVVYGSKGALDRGGLTVQREEAIETYSMHHLVRRMIRELDPGERERMFPRGVTDTFATELYDFYTSVVEGSKPEVDGWEAYRDMAIPLGFYESAALGRPVRVRDVEQLKVEEYQAEINDKIGLL